MVKCWHIILKLKWKIAFEVGLIRNSLIVVVPYLSDFFWENFRTATVLYAKGWKFFFTSRQNRAIQYKTSCGRIRGGLTGRSTLSVHFVNVLTVVGSGLMDLLWQEHWCKISGQLRKIQYFEYLSEIFENFFQFLKICLGHLVSQTAANKGIIAFGSLFVQKKTAIGFYSE